MKIYVITKGEYSEYHICGVALDYEHAKEIRELLSRGSYYQAIIEEYDTDKWAEYLKDEKLFRIEMQGDRTTCEYADIEDLDDDNLMVPRSYDFPRNIFYIYVMARNEEHAIKIAADKLKQYKIEKEMLNENAESIAWYTIFKPKETITTASAGELLSSEAEQEGPQ